jgi:hypothetical protein
MVAPYGRGLEQSSFCRALSSGLRLASPHQPWCHLSLTHQWSFIISPVRNASLRETIELCCVSGLRETGTARPPG